jgi:hypothetical protein
VLIAEELSPVAPVVERVIAEARAAAGTAVIVATTTAT